MSGRGSARSTGLSERVDAALAVLGDRARRDEPLAPMTTYKVGGSAALFTTVDSVAQVQLLVEAVRASGLATLAVGRGSNLLVADEGFEGIAFRLSGEFEQWSLVAGRDPSSPMATVRAGGAVSLPVLARQTVAAGLTGFAWAVGVPGSIGGAVRMNAGGHGSDMAGSLVRVRVVDLGRGEDMDVPAGSLGLAYRHSSIEPAQVVLHAELALARGDAAAARDEMAEVVRWRRDHQPGGQNAGSVFTNPPGDSAGRLIEAAGAKGLRVGSAEVSPKHANFIQADPGGTAADVVALMEEVKRLVADSFGVELVAETRLVGF